MGIQDSSLQLWVALIAGLCGLTSSQQTQPRVTTSISTPENGENFTVQCTIIDDPNFIMGNLEIKRKNGTREVNMVTVINGVNVIVNSEPSDLGDLLGRLSFDLPTKTLTVSNAACTDELGSSETYVYVCKQHWNRQGTGSGGFTEDSKPLRLKVPPGSATMPNNVPQFKVEGESLSVVCTANVGRGDKGRIVWTVVSMGIREVVDLQEGVVSDGRVVFTEQAGDPSCSVIEQSTFTLTRLDRSRQGLVVGCYVVNEDYRPAVPSSCTDEFCKETSAIQIYYPASPPVITSVPTAAVEGDSVTLRCTSDAMPPAVYTWSMGNTTFSTGVVVDQLSSLTLDDLNLVNDTGEYICEAGNEIRGVNHTVNGTISLIIEASTPAPTSTTTATTSKLPDNGGNTGSVTDPDDSDSTNIIIAVCVSLGVLLLVGIVAGYILYKRRGKQIKETSQKPSNNQPMSFQNPQPDLVADEKKFNNPSLNNSFDNRGDDGLMYADLTYDNRPRSRKPMALGDTASEYSDVTMPQV